MGVHLADLSWKQVPGAYALVGKGVSSEKILGSLVSGLKGGLIVCYLGCSYEQMEYETSRTTSAKVGEGGGGRDWKCSFPRYSLKEIFIQQYVLKEESLVMARVRQKKRELGK